MHPALSIIVFTTLSGAGYGLLGWLGLAAVEGRLPADRGFGAAALGLALGAVTAGLLSSTLHLGHPERAWRAFSQWRSSWLSREGVASTATYAPASLFFLVWMVRGSVDGLAAGLALLAAIGAVLTVVSTAYIYRSLKPIAQWSTDWVPANFLALAIMTGALWLAAVVAIFGLAPLSPDWLRLVVVLVAGAMKLGYWRYIDANPGISSVESATGLGRFGQPRLFEAPHTAANYLLKEMGFHIARKHARKLRRIAVIAGFVLPFLLTLVAAAGTGWLRIAATLLAALSATVGVLVERWLFFAEAKHTVTLYYGATRA